MLRGAKNTIQGAKMAFGTPFLATPFGVALSLFVIYYISVSWELGVGGYILGKIENIVFNGYMNT